MTKKEFIEKLRQFKSDASAFSTNITCAGGSDLMSKIARAENLALWELIRFAEKLIDERCCKKEEEKPKQLQRIITVEIETISELDDDVISKREATELLKKYLYETTTASHVNVVRVQDFIHE